mgnify:CR=1 FL=1
MAGNHMSEMSPRQRMINMMYLVLTALLALNISKEVLEAFKTMDKSIEHAYAEKYTFNQKQYKEFQLKADNFLTFNNIVHSEVSPSIGH